MVTRVGLQGPTIEIESGDESTSESGPAKFVNFSVNDYLSLAVDPRLAAAAQRAVDREGWGAGASPLVIGHSESHRELERRLAAFMQTEAALVFPSGFAANSGTIPALVGRGDVIFADEKNHASLIDGCRLSRADVKVYPHRDVTRLAELLDQSGGARRRLIVSDTLFSMDGDIAPLADLVELSRPHRAMLMIDEAHAIGVFGANGRGIAEQLGVEAEVPIRVGTLSKALASAGGFVAGSRKLIDWLLNRRGRTYSRRLIRRPSRRPRSPPSTSFATSLSGVSSSLRVRQSCEQRSRSKAGTSATHPGRSCPSSSAMPAQQCASQPRCASGACSSPASARRRYQKTNRC